MGLSFLNTIDSDIPAEGLIILVGLPATGKSTVAKLIAERQGLKVFQSDVIRLEILKGMDIFDEKVASNFDKRRQVYEEMFGRAENLLGKDKEIGVLLDATFVNQDLREEATAIAEKCGRTLVIVECVCSEAVALSRIMKRSKDDYESNAITRTAYENNKAMFQPIDLNALKKKFQTVRLLHLKVDTTNNEVERWVVSKTEKP